MNKAAMNIFMCDFSEHMHLFFLSIYLGMELLGHMVGMFHSYGRCCQTVFQIDCNNLLSKQQGVRLSITLHLPTTSSCYYFFSILAIKMFIFSYAY